MAGPFHDPRIYHWLARPYALAQRALPVWQRYIRQALPWLQGQGLVLEIGPGPGVLLKALAEQQQPAVGLDLAWGMLREAQRQLLRANLPARLVQGDARQLSFLADSLGAAAMTFSLSAIPEGETVLREVARVLRPGGLAVIIDIAWPPNGNPGGQALAWLCQIGGDTIHNVPALMQQAGLVVTEKRAFGAFHSIHLTVGRKPVRPTEQREAR